MIDTKAFRIYLPKEKMIDWVTSIKEILEKGSTNSKTLEKTIGRLNHAAHILPHSRYFLNRTR